MKQSRRNFYKRAISIRIDNVYHLDCHANKLARNDGTRLRVADKLCMGVCPILRRTCAQPVRIRAMPENEIPRVNAGYFILHFKIINERETVIYVLIKRDVILSFRAKRSGVEKS